MSWLSPSPSEHEEFESLDFESDTAQLGLYLAPALRIDSTLLRNMRMRYFPRSNASLEAEIWFSSLAASRSARIISFNPGVARLLTDKLATDNTFSTVTDYIKTQTRDWPKELRIEQRLRLASRVDDTDTIETELNSLLAWFEYSEDDSSRIELLRWMRIALPDLIKPEWQIPQAHWLMQLAAAVLGDSTGELAASSRNIEGIPSWLHRHISEQQTGQIGFNIRPGQIEFVKAGTGNKSLPVGAAIPALIGIKESNEDDINWERIWPGKVVTISGNASRLELITITGQRFELLIEQGPDTEQPGTSFKTGNQIILYHLKEEQRETRKLAKQLKEMGFRVKLAAYHPDDPPRKVQTEVTNIRVWTSQSARYFSQSDINEDSFSEIVLRLDETPLPTGKSNILNIDLFDARREFSPSGLERLKSVLAGDAPRLTVWLSSGIGGEEWKWSVRDQLESNDIRCIDESTVVQQEKLDHTMLKADAVFVLHHPDSRPLMKGDKRIEEADTARKYFLPVLHVDLDGGLSPNALYHEHEEIISIEDFDEFTADVLQRRIEEWREQQVNSRRDRLIFISHSHDDRERVAILAEMLEAEGWSVWQDEDKLQGGDSFYPIIEKAIREAFCVLVCWSNTAIDSALVNEEAREAHKQDKLLPVLLETAKIPSWLRVYQSIDLSEWQGQKSSIEFKSLVAAIHHKLAEMENINEEVQSYSPEVQKLIEQLSDPSLVPMERLKAGDKLAEIGDPRPGVGLDAGGLPDIDWVEIPGGEFLYGEDKETASIDTFYMARYPVTNVQYDAFIQHGGYESDRCWDGLSERIKKPENSSWKQANRPRETVSWYEAIAFCRWLGDRLGFEVSLATEQQWERAARGSNGREYTWGDGYQSGYANIEEKAVKAGPNYLEQTSPVGMYDFAGSSEGIQDLSGNVWEWVLNEYENPDNISLESKGDRVLRGSSWFFSPGLARASTRGGRSPDLRFNEVGFRVVCSSPIAR